MSQTARFVRVGRTGEVPDGRPEVFDVEDRKIAVYRLDDGYYAIDDLSGHTVAAARPHRQDLC